MRVGGLVGLNWGEGGIIFIYFDPNDINLGDLSSKYLLEKFRKIPRKKIC